jgi:hypothetical protein
MPMDGKKSRWCHTRESFRPGQSHTLALTKSRYGSVIAAHLFRDREMAERIGPALFVDPVSFLLHLPDVAYNFVTLLFFN